MRHPFLHIHEHIQSKPPCLGSVERFTENLSSCDKWVSEFFRVVFAQRIRAPSHPVSRRIHGKESGEKAPGLATKPWERWVSEGSHWVGGAGAMHSGRMQMLGQPGRPQEHGPRAPPSKAVRTGSPPCGAQARSDL